MSGLSVALTGRVGQFTLDVAFAAPVGVTALVGPSGSGKTSVLRAIAGLQRLAGTVTLDGDTWQDDRRLLAPHQRRIGFLFQGPNLLPHLSVAENLAYARRRSPAPAELAPIIDATGIGPFLSRRPASLSGGEAQRAALARALAGNPRLLLMDEPLSALDQEARERLLDWLSRFLPTLNLPVLLVSHYPAEVARLATREIRLRNGRVER